ncbi:hybrid sensor histidine kinase/response regulator [Streptacidiphilus jiangxiensis]|uniref:histidine kinase n=1 Tax=Streptacidiphilus jiangxiensis TaxID=235985 RepID=A0A1H7J268_STRJI|nr:hybrid sensor histidine kinase/response regulator [Streptacidiphilus jiangxiensis]SEK67947.1 PAS domain S-box-containing protein [Streptacidiphilus jiangxiensis]
MSSRPTRGTARLAAILDALPDALLLVNSNGTVVDANAAAVRSLQAPGTSLVGRGVLSLLPDFDPSRIPGSMRPRKGGGAEGDEDDDAPVRMNALRTDGASLAVEVQAAEFEDDGRLSMSSSSGSSGSYSSGSYGSGSYYGAGPGVNSPSDRELLLIVVRDLSARLEVEAELRRQHKQTEMILRAAAEGVVGVDTDGLVVLVNPAAAHILGHRAGELGGAELLPLVMHSRPDGSPLPPEESPLADTLRSGRRHRVRTATLWRKDGRPVTVELSTAPVRDGDQLVGAVMTFTDRTPYLNLADRHEHLTAVLEQELRKPLDRLNDTLEQLARDPAGQLWPEANWVLRRLADECRRTSALVDGVLSYQRFDAAVEAGKEHLAQQPVQLDAVLNEAVAKATELLGAGRVDISVHPAQVELIGDADRLAEALGHLLAEVAVAPEAGTSSGNELYGMAVGVASGLSGRRPGGRHGARRAGSGGVVVAAAQRGEVARIELRGPGLGTGTVHEPIARRIVERHGGVLQSQELPDGQGRVYIVELPLDPANAAAFAPQPAPGENATTLLPELPLEPPAPAALPAGEAAAESATPAAGTPAQGQQTPAEGTDRSRRRNRLPAPEVVRPPRAQQEEYEQQQAEQLAALQAQQALQQSGQHLPALPGQESGAVEQQQSGEFPGLIGGPVYPGLEHALPPAGSVITPEQRRQANGNGRRRRLALGPAAGDEAPAGQNGAAPQSHGPYALPSGEEPAETGPAALQPVHPAVPPVPSMQPGTAPAPMAAEAASAPFGGRFELGPAPAPAPAQGAREAREANGGVPMGRQAIGSAPGTPVPQQSRARSHAALPLPPAAPVPNGGTFGGRGGVMSLSQSPLQAVQTPPAGTPLPTQPTPPHGHPVPQQFQAQSQSQQSSAQQPGDEGPLTESRLEFIAGADYPTMVAPASDGRPRRLLVWPEPDPSTRQALQERGYKPILVRTRDELDAQVPGFPAALFVDPLTEPITRTALQSLRTAAGDANVPVLVTAGLGQATPEAAYGADPAVLLRALAPRDSERHAPRVLLIEQDPHVASAFTAALERRGMHVEHAASENDAVSRASSVQPNLVVMDLMLIRRRRMGIVDWLRGNNRLHRTPLVVYTSVDGPEQRAGLRSGETVLFLAERSTSPEVQARIVDLLGRIGALGET